MKFGMAVIIFFLAIITLVAEFILYIFMGIGTSFSGDISTLSGIAIFFVSLMVLTASIGILAPICAFIEFITKKKNIGLHSMLILLGLIFVGLIFFNIHGGKENIPKNQTQKNDVITKEKMEYYGKIIIRDISAGKKEYLGNVVSGEIKNTGEKTLKEIEIMIYFLDKDGRAVYEEKYYPVSVRSAGTWPLREAGQYEPLKPNYSTKFLKSETYPPSDWSGKVDIKISNIEFMD